MPRLPYSHLAMKIRPELYRLIAARAGKKKSAPSWCIEVLANFFNRPDLGSNHKLHSKKFQDTLNLCEHAIVQLQFGQKAGYEKLRTGIAVFINTCEFCEADVWCDKGIEAANNPNYPRNPNAEGWFKALKNKVRMEREQSTTENLWNWRDGFPETSGTFACVTKAGKVKFLHIDSLGASDPDITWNLRLPALPWNLQRYCDLPDLNVEPLHDLNLPNSPE